MNSGIYSRVGNALREYRTTRGLTQAEMAERLGTTQTNLSKFERGLGGLNKEAFSRACDLVGVVVPSRGAGIASSEHTRLANMIALARTLMLSECNPESRLLAAGAILDSVLTGLRAGAG